MFRKGNNKKFAETSALLANGWGPELVVSLVKWAKRRNLVVPTCDYEAVFDGYTIDSKNFDVERKAYGSIGLRLLESAMEVNVPVVAYFVCEEDSSYQEFQTRLTDRDIFLDSGSTRVFGRVILNEMYVSSGFDKDELLPVLEWYLYLQDREWMVVKEILELSDHGYCPRISIRVGFLSNIEHDSIVNDSMNSRLLIYRVWVDTVKVFNPGRLRRNGAYRIDQGDT